MDEEGLEEATERWVEAGIIDRDTATAIQEHEARRDGRTSRQLTTILAGMGAALIGAGILIFLGANWDALPRWGRALVLISVPAGLAIGSIALDRRGLGRPAMGTWILAAIAVGPSLVLLTDLYAPGADGAVPLVIWGAIAVPMGHAFRTRLATGIGLAAFVAAGVLAGDEGAGFLLAGAIATLYLAAAPAVAVRARALSGTYRFLGIGTILGTFLWGTIVSAQFVEPGPALNAPAGVGLVGTVTIAIAVGLGYGRDVVGRDDALLVVVSAAGMVVLWGLIATLDLWPWLVGFFAVHGALLGLLIALVSIALSLDSPALVNLLVFGFFLQIVTLLGPLTDVLPGAATLVIVGVILLVVAVGLERIRRRLLERVAESS